MNPVDHGRRVGTAVLLALVCGGLVQVLLDNPEQSPLASVAVASSAARTDVETTTTRVGVKATDPRAVARRWYAARHHIDEKRVRVLQVDKLSPTRVRVLLMLEKPNGRLDTAAVGVAKRGGRWQVRR